MIYTVNLTNDFSKKLVDFVFKRHSDPMSIARTTIILPTKRACKNVKDAFVRVSDGKSFLLPKLIPLYELDDLEQDIPNVISPSRRLFWLAKLCAKKPNVQGMDQALKMAVSLTEILDELYQFEIDPRTLKTLVPEKTFAEHWNQTLVFLDIIITAWPQILAENKLIDAMDKNIRLMNHFASEWWEKKPTGQIIMAGFNGNIPAVRRLIHVLNQCDNGIIVMHGLQTQTSPDTYDKSDESHFQFGFKKLLDFLKLRPAQIENISSTPTARESFIHESLKPAADTDSWQDLKPFPADTLQHVARIDCDNSAQEALTVALLLRQVLETPERTATLVTGDRNLARRVIVEMRRWGIELNDSAGKPLPKTEIGAYLMLVANMGIDQQPNTLLSLLKHPLTADGKPPAQMRLLVKQAEKSARASRAKFALPLNTQLNEFVSLFVPNKLTPFADILKHHLAMAESLAATNDQPGAVRLWNGEDGKTAFEFLTELLADAPLLGDIEPAVYPSILEILMNRISVRPAYGTHPRLSILGPIESRLFHTDVCIIGGLNEGIWPAQTDTGPWLSRPMRAKIGLPALEEKISESALDFAHNFCAPTVYLTRAIKVDGTPAIPSRFLSRMEAVAKAAGLSFVPQNLAWADLMNEPTSSSLPVRPAPCPPVDARPRKLSITEIKTWMSDPYSIYAKHILKLRPLDDLEENKKAPFYGSAIHDALHRFLIENSAGTDENQLMELFKSELKKYPFTPSELSFLMPQMQNIAAWFADQQKQRQGQARRILTEQTGTVALHPRSRKPFELHGRADRIDVMNDNSVELIDYKTGSVPTANEVKFGYEPQLPLEAYMLANNGFPNISKHPLGALTYWKLSGKKDASAQTPACKNIPIETLVDETIKKLMALIDAFDDVHTPYESCPVPAHIPRYNDYEHLARIKEWAHADEDGGDE